MESTLVLLAICMMFSGAHGGSQSMSCSTVNGKTICDRQVSQGNNAAASSQSGTGPGFDVQRTYAGAGDASQWDYSSQYASSGFPGGYNSLDNDYSDFPAPHGIFGGLPGGSSSTFSSSSSNSGPQGGAGGFGGFSGGYSSSFSSSSSNSGPPGGAGGFGFASAGGFPFFPGFGYPPQAPSGGAAPSAGGPTNQGPAIPTNPFDFVNGFMGGGLFPGGGPFAGAGAGAFAFGRR